MIKCSKIVGNRELPAVASTTRLFVISNLRECVSEFANLEGTRERDAPRGAAAAFRSGLWMCRVTQPPETLFLSLFGCCKPFCADVCLLERD